MWARCVLLLIVVATLVLAKPQHRELRQVWGFPEDSMTPNRLPVRPSNSSTSTTTTSTTSGTVEQGGSTTTAPPPRVIFQIPNCDCPAPPQYNPVCGTDGNTYVNRQKLMCARQCGSQVQETRMGSC